jgi:hypothetical protein
MSVRIPNDASQNVQNAFRDMEQEIEDLKAALSGLQVPVPDSGSEIAEIKQRLLDTPYLNDFVDDKNVFVAAGEQHSPGLVPDPGAYTGGNDSLLANGEFGNPDLLRLNDDEQSERGTDDIYTLPGSLHVNGSLSAGEINASLLRVGGKGLVTVINAQVNAAASSGTGETDAHLFTIPANTMTVNGDTLVIKCTGTLTSNSNAKTWKLYFDTALVVTVTASTASTTFFNVEAWIQRLTASSAICIARPAFYNSTVVASTSPGAVLDSSVDFTADIAIKTTVQMATSGTTTETSFAVVLEPA